MKHSHMQDVKDRAEIAVAGLLEMVEARHGYRGNEAARELDDIWGRLAYTDRGPEPTTDELEEAFQKYAGALRWEGLNWR